MHIADVDVADDEAFARWFAPVLAADVHDAPHDPPWLEIELRALGRTTRESRRVLTSVADDDGQVVGGALTIYPLLENLGGVEVMVLSIDPAHRRRGHGRALLEGVLGRVARGGRRTAIVPIDSHGAPAEVPGEHFARALGFTLGLQSTKRRIELPPDDALLERLFEEAAAHAHDYELVAWTGACPAAWLAGRLRLAVGMSTDTPTGDIDFDEAQWDAERLREFERVCEEMGRRLYSTGAVHRASGELVAFSDVAVSTIEPVIGYQYDTIVLGEHRGHRLGTLVKIANLRAVASASPTTTMIDTWNADTNEPMIRVNELLGFRKAARGGIWQRHLEVDPAAT